MREVILCIWFIVDYMQLFNANLVNPISITIVKDTTKYGRLSQIDYTNTDFLIPKRKPTDFTGPNELNYLRGKCFHYSTQKYLFEFCPFDNVTQRETTVTWRASFSAIIGLWSGNWIIVNNTFTAMIYTDGDNCGEKGRSVIAQIACGENDAVVDVKESVRCEYEINFETPIACLPQNLLVYPRLSPGLQKKWDLIETKLSVGLLTQKGYEQELNDLFIEAGLSSNISTKQKSVTPIFNNMSQCIDAYTKLADELKRYRET
ncbi:N-acetylglucosamine-1-phosphotransferase subunit gamma-like protein [Dinothrombium tinctorium]|uniref:N-acetylglucosamine-1-phosphotransferase subunit gamma-like protein n=1 Tax=Dinothrombium tinctorium TaxID=1965070 RepID=A0A3S3R1U5_9ACAR|nr:N-acetylglucosamine-1-phosphotransferase subunit gamma-like protein [Dinothrombium tinctorium]